jgi:hypothetical protein
MNNSLSSLRVLPLSVLSALAFAALFFGAEHARAADRYWVGAANGSDRWEAAANWSLLPRGAGGATVPGYSDQAIFSFSGSTVRLRSKPTVGNLLLSNVWTGSFLFGTGGLNVASNVRVGSEYLKAIVTN